MLNKSSLIMPLQTLSKVKVPVLCPQRDVKQCPSLSCESRFNFLMATDDVMMMMMMIMICELFILDNRESNFEVRHLCCVIRITKPMCFVHISISPCTT